jgi:Ca2+-binding RTX toxin-like protein
MLRQMARTLPLCLLAAACATEDSAPDLGDLGDLEGIEEVGAALTDLSAQCSVTGTTATLALTGSDIAMVSKATDGKILVNGFACATATTTAVKQFAVTGAAGDQTVILDFLPGTFLPGVQGTIGFTVDLGAGTADALKIRGTKAVDSYTFGSTGVALNSDNFVDLTVAANVEEIVVTLGDGNDVFSGAGNVLTGGAAFPAAVTVYGGAGNDSIRGGAGDDVYFGGDGLDTFLTGTADDGSDEMNGGAGVDTVDYSGRTAALTVTVDGTNDDGLALEADDVKTDVETVKGGTADDDITGSSGDNTLFGGAGDDTLAGGDGVDILNGDAGDDTFDEGMATSGGDTFNGGAGSDTVTYTDRTNTVTVALTGTAVSGENLEADKVMVDVENAVGGGGGDTMTGSAVANVLDGGAGGDTITGGDGNDTLKGGAGVDTLNGGNGDDTFDEEAATNNGDTFNGGLGVDTVSYAARSNDVDIKMDATATSGESGENDTVAADVENAVGGGGDDEIDGNGLDNLLRGGLGADDLDGGAGDDVIDGEGGSDAVDCGAGDGDILLDATTSSAANCEL